MKEISTPTFKSFWEIEVRDKNGKVTYKHRQRSHSWVRNAYNHLFGMLAGKDLDDATFGAGLLSGKNTAGAVQSGDGAGLIGAENSADGLNAYRAGAGIDTWGILVGSGTNAESFEDYALQTKIDNGVSAGQLSYVESEAHSITYTAGTKTLKNDLARYFNNNSGDTITVNELAIAFRGQLPGATPDAYRYYILARDKLASAVNIPDTGQLKVTYTIQLVYPA